MNSTSALNALTRKFKQLERAGSYRDFKAFLSGPEYRRLLYALSPLGTQIAGNALVQAQQALLPDAPLPKKWSARVRWTAERIAALKAAEAKYGDDKAIACALGVPFHNARRARLRYIGHRPCRSPLTMQSAARAVGRQN